MSKFEYIGTVDRLALVKKGANLDYMYGPYESVEKANEVIPIELRELGRTVAVIVDNSIVEYWYKNGIQNNNLVEKISDGSSEVFPESDPTSVSVGSLSAYTDISGKSAIEIITMMVNPKPYIKPEVQLPYYATTTSINVLTAVRPSESSVNNKTIVMSLASETSDPLKRQIVKIPKIWGSMKSCSIYNVFTQSYTYQGGSESESLTFWDVSSETITVDGTPGGVTEYNVYTYNDSVRGNVQVQIKLN